MTGEVEYTRVVKSMLIADSGTGVIELLSQGDADAIDYDRQVVVYNGDLYTFTNDTTIITESASYTLGAAPSGDGPSDANPV